MTIFGSSLVSWIIWNNENPNKVVLELHLFGDESVINGEANRIEGSTAKEYETIETKDVDEIDI